jgi:hypothetical protein
VVFECRQRDYPASFEVPALVRKHAGRLGADLTGGLERVVFLNWEVQRPEDLLGVDAGGAQVVCAKISDAGSPPGGSSGHVLLGSPKAAD